MATSDTPLHFLTIHQAGELMRKGELSPVELTRACLDRIADTDDRLHSFILLLADDAMEQARVAESEILRGEYRGHMHGIPFALKDLYDTAGVRTTSGSRVDIDRVPAEDATTTARLKAAGGILLALLLLILRRRQAAAPDLTDEPAEFEDEDPAPAAAGDAAPEQAEDEPAGAATANAPTATDQVLTEIDLALAQAQTDEALDLVERALDESPSPAPVALRLKHAEVLAAAGLPAALDEALDRLEADPAARAHPDWPAVAALRAQAEPAGAAEAEPGPVAGQETASVDRTALLDLDLDEAEPEADEAAAVQDEPLEFDQPVDGPGAGPAATGIPPDEQAEALESKLDLARAYLEMEAYEEARAALDVVAAQGSSLQRQEADTLRLQLPDAEVSAAPTPPADAMPASLDEAPSLPAAAPAAADDAEDVDESAADESSWLSEEESAVETKLDLARAYVGMEDLEGARGLLREVLEEGDDDQQAQAQRMLDELP